MLCNQHVFRINALRMRRFRGTSMKAWRCDFDKHGVGAALSAFHSPKWKATQKSEKKGPPRKDERCPRGKIFKSDFNSFVFSSLISMKLCDFCERFEPIAADCNSFHHEVGSVELNLPEVVVSMGFNLGFFSGRNPVSWYDVKWYSKTMKCIMQRSHKSWPIDFIRHNLVRLFERNWFPFF